MKRIVIKHLFYLILFSQASCPEERPSLSAYRVTNRAQLIGGPKQYGDVGDFMLENAFLKALVLDAGHAVSPALWGGALVDMDLQRPFQEFRNANGLDQMFMVLPMVNIMVPNPTTGKIDPLLSSSRNMASIRVTGQSERVLAVLNLLDMVRPLGIKTRFAMMTDYTLGKDAKYIEVTTTFRALGDETCDNQKDDDGDGLLDCEDPDCSLDKACPSWCSSKTCAEDEVCDPFYAACLKRCDKGCDDGECDELTNLCVPKPVSMQTLRPKTDLLDALSGGLFNLLSGQTIEVTKKPGFVAGDMVLFGASVASFAPDLGFEIDSQYRMLFLRGGNPLLSPPSFEFLAGTGDRVSYAYFTLDGAVLFPFATESLTGSLTHGLNCLISEEDDEVCDNVPFVRYKRYVAIGEGDVASLLETIYQLRNTEYGKVRGKVIWQKSGIPVSKAMVFAIKDPCDPKNCTQVVENCGGFKSYEELRAFVRLCTKTSENPDGYGLVQSMFLTDRGMDSHPDGSFSGPLTPGTYYLVAKKDKGPLSPPVKVQVEPEQEEIVVLSLPEPATLKFRVLDEAGRPVSARVSIGHCFPECHTSKDCKNGEVCDEEFHCRPEKCTQDAECDYDEECYQGKCICRRGLLVGEPLEELGDSYLSDRKVAVLLSPTGEGQIELPPGKYDVIFSHGFEYSIDAREVTLSSGLVTFVDARVHKVVDARGYLSIDQHSHTVGSPDSSVSGRDRLMSAIADGLEVLVSTDHDYIQDLRPVVNELQLHRNVLTFPGLEITTLDISHIIGWPLKYQWESSNHGAMNWVQKTPREIFRWIRENGLFSPDETLVVIPHPRGGMSSYFDVYGLNPFTLELEQGLIQAQSPLLAKENFVPEFDALEILNDKRMDLLRTPTYGEMVSFNSQMYEFLHHNKGLPRGELVRFLKAAGTRAIQDMIVRTPAEQDAILRFGGSPKCVLPDFCPDGICRKGFECRENLCLKPCTSSKECDEGFECKDGYCEIPKDLPCEAVKGLPEDWFRMLDFGVFKPAVGGGDIHGIADFEVGSLRTYVKSAYDEPLGNDPTKVVEAIKKGQVFVSYGPFIEVSIDGKGPGEIAFMKDKKSLELRIRVQSPLWFDVSRVEVFRNGALDYVFDADAHDKRFKITVPNDSIINLDTILEISPTEDSWYVVLAMGSKGRTLSPVYGSNELLPVYLGDLFAGLVGALPISLPSYIAGPKTPPFYPQFPFAVSNPVFVDVDGVDERGCIITPKYWPPPSWLCAYPDGTPEDKIPCVCRGVR